MADRRCGTGDQCRARAAGSLADVRRRPTARSAVLALALAVFGGACGSSDDSGPLPHVDGVLVAAGEAMSAVSSASFIIERTGARIDIAGATFNAAEGKYLAPDSAQALLDAAVGEVSIQMATVAIGDQVWLTNPLTGAWELLPTATGFNPAILFDRDEGWAVILPALQDARVVERRGGSLVVMGAIDAFRTEVLTAGIVTGQAVILTIVLEESSSLLETIDFVTTGPGSTSDWSIELSGYGDTVIVNAPDV